MLSDSENEVALVLARLLGFGMSQTDGISNEFRSVPLAFGLGVADPNGCRRIEGFDRVS